MEIDAPPNSPALDAARAEMKDMATNPQNPRHAGYQRGDRDVQAYLDQLYAKALPNPAPVDIGNEGVTLRTGGPDDDAPPVDPAVTQAIAELQHEQGEAYPAFAADVQFGFTRLAHTLGGEVDDLTAAALAAGIEWKAMTTFLHHFGKQARTYAP